MSARPSANSRISELRCWELCERLETKSATDTFCTANPNKLQRCLSECRNESNCAASKYLAHRDVGFVFFVFLLHFYASKERRK